MSDPVGHARATAEAVDAPERLIDQANDLEARLLSAGLDEAPPPELLARTLSTVGAAASAAAPGAAASAAAAAAGKAAGGGILGAVAIGTIAGVLTVGGYEIAAGRRAPPPAITAVAPPMATAVTPVAPPPPPPPAAPAPSVTASSPAPASASPARPVTLAAELELLDGARSAQRAGDRARARALLDRYAREIPRPQLAREAAMLRAELAEDGGMSIP